MSDITAVLHDLQQSMINVQTTHLHIRNKATTGRNFVQSQMAYLEEIDSRTSRVENMTRKNEGNLKSVLQMAQNLQKKTDSLFATVKRSVSLPQSSNESTKHSPPDKTTRPCAVAENNCRSNVSDGTNVGSGQIRPQQDRKSHSNTTSVNSKISSVTSKTDSLSNVKNIEEKRTTDLNNSNHVTTKQSTTSVEQKSELKSIKMASGLKSCLTKDDEDNRICYRNRSKCYQGQLLPPCKEKLVTVITENPKPNIVPVAKTQNRIPAIHSPKQNEMMTMATLSEGDFRQRHNVHSLHEWYNIAGDVEVRVSLNLLINAGKVSGNGHMYVLLLDVSESMRGEKFDMMIKTAKEYIKGHQVIRAKYGMNDNIGLACFGENTDLLIPPMNDYDGLIAELDKLKPCGPSPMAAGMLVSLAAISRGLGNTKINKHFFRSNVIVMTDGTPTRLEALSEEENSDENNPLAASSFLMNFQRDKELNAVIADFIKRGFRIYCVPFGSTNNDLLTSISKATFGRVVPHEQIHSMSRMTMSMFDASEIACKLHYSTDVNSDIVSNALVANKVQDPYNDIMDLVMGLLDPRRLYPGFFKKPKWRTTPLGTRVRRGPHWKYKNEDNGCAGTVIGGGVNDESLLWIEWDHGHRNAYVYEENKKIFEIKPVNERRVLVDDLIAVGCRVKRGKDWKHGDQDGGNGSTGTVLRVDENGRVFVYWDRDKLAVYMFAVDDLFEVEVCNEGRRASNTTFRIEDQAIRDPPMPKISDSQHILPSHSIKTVKPVSVSWQYQNENGGWTPYEEDTNIKIEKAFSRKPNGNCIVEHSGNVYVVHFARMTQENQSSRSVSAIRRLEKKSIEKQERLIYED